MILFLRGSLLPTSCTSWPCVFLCLSLSRCSSLCECIMSISFYSFCLFLFHFTIGSICSSSLPRLALPDGHFDDFAPACSVFLQHHFPNQGNCRWVGATTFFGRSRPVLASLSSQIKCLSLFYKSMCRSTRTCLVCRQIRSINLIQCTCTNM